ncbi:MAG: flavodoxin family protein, partial [Duncaniella dubosii]|nr:flavodoxin family protein [Duncaniella dubosii]
MKKVVIVNGSPRKNGNTAALCDAFQDGVQSVAESAEVFRFDLNDYSFKGCQSCFSCKLKNGNGYGRCSLKDDLSRILEEISDADCLVVASPIYLMDVSAAETYTHLTLPTTSR